MKDNIEIRVPFIVDDPITGRTISPFPLGVFDEYIFLEEGKLIYKHSKISTKANKSYSLKDLKKITEKTKKISPFKKDFNLDLIGRFGTEVTLDLVDINGDSHRFIPKFLITTYGHKEWDRFLDELQSLSGLPLETLKES
ncbi:MAG: hypothetical protein GY705_06055 [Bacteroidetes bacterium]|nr:hypothetical protein [Bacteroidota bacterium]